MKIAAIIGRCGYLRFPYQATVMKMLETISRRIVVIAPG
jgi:hypothetical protein